MNTDNILKKYLPNRVTLYVRDSDYKEVIENIRKADPTVNILPPIRSKIKQGTVNVYGGLVSYGPVLMEPGTSLIHVYPLTDDAPLRSPYVATGRPDRIVDDQETGLIEVTISTFLARVRAQTARKDRVATISKTIDAIVKLKHQYPVFPGITQTVSIRSRLIFTDGPVETISHIKAVLPDAVEISEGSDIQDGGINIIRFDTKGDRPRLQSYAPLKKPGTMVIFLLPKEFQKHADFIYGVGDSYAVMAKRPSMVECVSSRLNDVVSHLTGSFDWLLRPEAEMRTVEIDMFKKKIMGIRTAGDFIAAAGGSIKKSIKVALAALPDENSTDVKAILESMVASEKIRISLGLAPNLTLQDLKTAGTCWKVLRRKISMNIKNCERRMERALARASMNGQIGIIK